MTQLTPENGIAVVTGAGSGLGRALALELAAQGFTVVGTGRRADALTETRDKAPQGRFTALPCDVSDPGGVTQAFAGIEADIGPVSLLINNAAVYPHADFLESTPEDFMRTVGINLGGVVNCSHAALRGMVERGHGRILNISTFADLDPLPASSAYAVSKGAGRIFTRALIKDVCDRFPGIVISDWMPGMLRTEMGIPDGLPPEKSAKWGVALARDRDPSLTGTVFEQDTEVLPPRSLKRRLKDLVLLRRAPAPRRL